jgi:hypothetical protein
VLQCGPQLLLFVHCAPFSGLIVILLTTWTQAHELNAFLCFRRTAFWSDHVDRGAGATLR